MKRVHGFTLIEMIVAMVITGIIAAMVSVFMVAPIKGYQDTVRRAGLSDAADTALKRMALEIRTALPNSVRVSGNQYIEFIPTTGGGRYRADFGTGGTGDPLNFDFSGDCTGVACSFDVLGPNVTIASGDHLVIFNTGQTGLNAYGATTGNNRRPITTAAGSVSAITFSGAAFPYESPSQRFHVVSSTLGPVTFGCDGGKLRRYTGYATGSVDWNPAPADQPDPPTSGSSALLADGATCYFDYDPAVSAENGLVTLRITLTDGPSGESVTLHQQLHVDNSP